MSAYCRSECMEGYFLYLILGAVAVAFDELALSIEMVLYSG